MLHVQDSFRSGRKSGVRQLEDRQERNSGQTGQQSRDYFGPEQNSKDITNIEQNSTENLNISSGQEVETPSVKNRSACDLPLLRLASFADLASNGIQDCTPLTAMKSVPVCGFCGSGTNLINSANIVWETMHFCNESCLGEFHYSCYDRVFAETLFINTSCRSYIWAGLAQPVRTS